MNQIETFIAFSGGIDSTYNLWRWLKDNPDDIILVHHVTYYNQEGRAEYEKKAVDQVLDWLRKNGLTNFHYVESILDLRQFRRIGLDTITLASLHGTLLKGYWEVKYWVTNTPKNEYSRLGDGVMARREKAKEIIKVITGKRYQSVYGLDKMTKREIINSMPKELFELTWWCRRPKEDGTVCGKCHTCKQVKEVVTNGE